MSAIDWKIVDTIAELVEEFVTLVAKIGVIAAATKYVFFA